VYAYVAYRVGREQEAEDTTSDAFLRVLEKIREFEWRGEGTFAAWIFLLAVLGFALGVSPRVRGAALELIQEVGGLRFMETSNYPGGDEGGEIVDSMQVSLDEVRLIFPGTISLPTFIPAGYSLDPEVELIDFQDGDLPIAIVNWEANPDGKRRSLRLQIIYKPEDVQNLAEVVGEGVIEEITINGKPAALLGGGWNYDTRSYDPDIPSLRIRWVYDERTICELNGSEAMEPEVLIENAESIK
jgi:hypothetical protein